MRWNNPRGISMFLNCMDPLARNLAIVVTIALILSLSYEIFLIKAAPRVYLLTAFTFSALVGGTVWLGSYTSSPIMHYANGQDSTLRALQVTRSLRDDVVPADGGAIALVGGSPSAISALTIPANARCIWASKDHATMDGVDSCELVYLPPSNATYDILRIHVIPGCQLPESNGQIKINLFP